MKTYVLFLCYFFSYGWALQSKATHIVGGDLHLKYLQGSTYEIQFNLYFDLINGIPSLKDDIIRIAIFDKVTNERVDTLTLIKDFEQELDYKQPLCRDIYKIRVLHIYFKRQITFDMSRYTSPDGYYLVWQKCCRNASVNNIVSPINAGNTFYLEMPKFATILGNSTPKFSVPKAEYLCYQKPTEIDFSATDADGDELRYYLDHPISSIEAANFYPAPAPYPLVTWKTDYPYSPQTAIPHDPAFPAHQLTANSTTGKLTVTPSRAGLYVLSLRCEEYRNGIKIGQVIRDFQFMVVDCPVDVPPTLRLKTGNQQYYEEGQDLYVGSEVCFDVEAMDMNFPEKLEFSLTPLNFTATNQFTFAPTVAYTTTSSNIVVAKLCWSKCIFSTQTSPNVSQPFIFRLGVKDQSCPTQAEKNLVVRLINVNDTIPATFSTNAPPDIVGSHNYTLVRYPNQAFEFDMEGFDANSDVLSLTMTGRGFNPIAEGMKCPITQGAGKAVGKFYWIRDCKSIKFAEQEFILDFVLKENSKCGIIERKKTVKLLLLDKGVDFDKFSPPNAFSPNGDAMNPTFELSGLLPNNCRQDFQQIIIYDRLGNKVFESDKRDFEWDGTGYPASTYFYVIAFRDRKVRGTITLVR